MNGAPDDLLLRPATLADLDWVEALAQHEAVAATVSTTAAADLVQAIAEEELWIALEDGRRVGAVRVAIVNHRSRIAAVRTLMVHPGARGRRLGVAILEVAARDAFARGIHRLEAEVYGFNEAALRTFDAAGYTREGVRRRAYDRHGAWQDGIHFGLLAGD